jgi:hypothetical protein
MSRFTRRISVALLAVIVLGAAARGARGGAYFSATGTFTSASGVIDFGLTLPTDAAPLELRTWQSSGGTNAAGQLILPLGIDSVLALFDSANAQIAQNDDMAPGAPDSLIRTAPLSAGDYRARLTAKTRGDGHFALDMSNPAGAGALTLRAPSTLTAASLANLSLGATRRPRFTSRPAPRWS